jgi:superfamily II DNA helicase RecQ
VLSTPRTRVSGNYASSFAAYCADGEPSASTAQTKHTCRAAQLVDLSIGAQKGTQMSVLSPIIPHLAWQVLLDLQSSKPNTKLLYVTPESIATDSFMAELVSLYNRNLLSAFIIDEVRYLNTQSIHSVL